MVKLADTDIVLGQNNEPLTARYPDDNFRYVLDGARSDYQLATLGGNKPRDAIIALAAE